MKKIDLLKTKIALWLLSNRTMTATSVELLKRTQEMRCDHCGLSPIHYLDKKCCDSLSDKREK